MIPPCICEEAVRGIANNVVDSSWSCPAHGEILHVLFYCPQHGKVSYRDIKAHVATKPETVCICEEKRARSAMGWACPVHGLTYPPKAKKVVAVIGAHGDRDSFFDLPGHLSGPSDGRSYKLVVCDEDCFGEHFDEVIYLPKAKAFLDMVEMAKARCKR